ncbi:hypothetical protein [Rhodococcus wratislaviensis]|uniref:Uncharacterized protein n=1 Tax=Rhodococcus wratislaviensis NBRC 100605 TaxID=1219028 RepID=X0RCN9_RHOWR|nr:hypothetical protein [Rhodococcus wratislaviensis]GAF48810.1 hypothetical protein RW1_060_00190 [Rhodococcus wratislaviensis NBRC 100605]
MAQFRAFSLGGPNFIRLDFTRLPNARERKQLQLRKKRLEDAEDTMVSAMARVQELVTVSGLSSVRIRGEFVRRIRPAPGDPSDRSAVAPEHRPPSTRLMSPNGIALPFFLISLLEAQSRTAPGHRPEATPIPIRRVGDEVGWTDFISTSAKTSGQGRHLMSRLDKKQQQVERTLDRLRREQLVHLPNLGHTTATHEGFVLMREGWLPEHGDNDLYRVPDEDEDYFTVPVELFTQGWIYVLADSELALLLIVARWWHIHGSEKTHYLSAGPRQRHYGLSRDSYEAHMMLGNLRLMEVIADSSRWLDNSKAEDYPAKGVKPHELRFLPDGLKAQAFPEILKEIDYQLVRR